MAKACPKSNVLQVELRIIEDVNISRSYKQGQGMAMSPHVPKPPLVSVLKYSPAASHHHTFRTVFTMVMLLL
jgi:hypothetical protein